MGIKTILAITELHAALGNVEKAISVARACGAHLTLLNIGEVPDLPFYGYGGQGYLEIWAKDCDERKAELVSITADLEERLAREDISYDVRPYMVSAAREDNLISRHAIYCDMTLLLRSGETELNMIEKKAIDGALFDAGRPVLCVPASVSPNGFGGHAAIAWNAHGEAARAVFSALPLLKQAREITLLVVDPVVGDEDHGEDPGTDIALVLARHDVRIDVLNIASAGRSVSEVLLETTQELAVDLLVMGAYGHSRLQENILGGTTRDMLELSSVALLLSH